MPLFLPLEQNPKCHQCAATDNTRLCASCGEIAYCSQECQKADWKRHKGECGETDKIDLGIMYPFLAILIDYGHQIAQRPDFPTLNHPALRHKIMNDANFGEKYTLFLDGWKGLLVELGDPMPHMDPILKDKDWWPKARNLRELNKLRARIRREGNLVPILFAICVALAETIYTTTYEKGESGKERARLHFRGAPIVDFGICSGSVRVVAQDKLAYKLPDGTCMRGQDPDEHYWIYFLTSRGEEFMLDCSMFTFNLDMEVQNTPYISDCELELFPTSPAWVEGRRTHLHPKQIPRLADRVRRRVSVLRHPTLQRALQNSEAYGGKPVFLLELMPVMDEIAGRECRMAEKEFLIHLTALCINKLYHTIVRKKEWKLYPKDVIATYGLDEDGNDPMVRGKKIWKKLKAEEKREEQKGEMG